MAAGSITISQGCDYKMSITIFEVDGTKKDLTDYEARFRINNKQLTQRYVDIQGVVNNIEGTEGGTALVVDPVNGVVEVKLNPHTPEQLPTNNDEDAKSKTIANNIYSLVIIHTLSGEITKILQADCKVEPEL